MKTKLGIGLVALLLVVGVVYAKQAEALSLRAFVDMLIDAGIIAADKEEQAKRAAAALEPEPAQAEKEGLAVKVSQLIQYGNLTYAVGDDIEGLVMNIENTTEGELLLLTGRSDCIVSYKLFGDDDELLYDNGESEACQSGEQVVFPLQPGEFRILPVTHEYDDYALAPGKYIVKLEYPGYGEGERVITVE